MGYIYCLFDIENEITRIGKTKNSDKSRQNSQIGYYPFKLLEFTVKVQDDYNLIETELHRKYNHLKTNGDWYDIKVNEVLNHLLDNYKWSECDFPSFVYIFKLREELSNKKYKSIFRLYKNLELKTAMKRFENNGNG